MSYARRGLTGYMTDRRYGYGRGLAGAFARIFPEAAGLGNDDAMSLGGSSEGLIEAGVRQGALLRRRDALGATPCQPGLGFDADGAGQGVGAFGIARRTRGYVVGPGRAVAPGASRVNVSDHTARRTTARLARYGYDYAGGLGEAADMTLGIAPLIAAEGIKVGVSTAERLLNPHPQDPGRYADNQTRYGQAINGDPNALRDLLSSSGQYGAETWARLYPTTPQAPPYTAGPWATDGPRQDAWQKYQQVVSGGGAPGTNAVVGPGAAQSSSILQDIAAAFFATPTGAAVQTAAVRGAVQQKQQQVGTFLAQNLGTVALAASALLVVLNMRHHRGR